MPIAGDLIRITDIQTFLDQTVLNVYFYEVSALTGTPDLEDTLQEFDNVLLLTVAKLQSTSLIHDRITWENVTDGLEIAEVTSGRGGTIAGTVGPSYISYNVKLRRTTALTRHGRKAIGGIADSGYSGNSPTPVIADRDAMLVALAGTIDILDAVAATIGTLDPVIPRRIPATGAPDPLNLNPVASAELRGMGTQNTRKLRAII